jgi:hypothetical protein
MKALHPKVLKVKLPALSRGASVAKPSETPPKPSTLPTLSQGKPVFAPGARPRSPIAILTGRSSPSWLNLRMLPCGAPWRRRVKPPGDFSSFWRLFHLGGEAMTWRNIVFMTGVLVFMLSSPAASEEWMGIENPKGLRGMKSRHAEERG